MSLARRRRRPSRSMPFTRSVISSLSGEELRCYCQIPSNIDFELSNDPAEPTMGPRKQRGVFHLGATRSWASLPRVFPSKAVLALHQSATCSYSSKFHSNSNWMLRAELPLPVGHFIGGGLFYLYYETGSQRPTVHVGQSPQLQFVMGLPDSPKIEAKGVILVRGPWYETLGSPDLPFVLNHLMSFPGGYK